MLGLVLRKPHLRATSSGSISLNSPWLLSQEMYAEFESGSDSSSSRNCHSCIWPEPGPEHDEADETAPGTSGLESAAWSAAAAATAVPRRKHSRRSAEASFRRLFRPSVWLRMSLTVHDGGWDVEVEWYAIDDGSDDSETPVRASAAERLRRFPAGRIFSNGSTCSAIKRPKTSFSTRIANICQHNIMRTLGQSVSKSVSRRSSSHGSTITPGVCARSESLNLGRSGGVAGRQHSIDCEPINRWWFGAFTKTRAI